MTVWVGAARHVSVRVRDTRGESVWVGFAGAVLGFVGTVLVWVDPSV